MSRESDTPISDDPGRPSKSHVYLSAALFPGAGQFAQKRWIPALLLSGLTLICIVMPVMILAQHISNNVNALMVFKKTGQVIQVPPLEFKKLLIPLGLAIVLYVIGVADSLLSYLKECREWGEKRLEERLRRMMTVSTVLFFFFAAAGTAGAGAIHEAVWSNSLPAISATIAKYGTNVVNQPTGNGWSPLHIAAAMNHRVAASYLITSGASLESTTTGGFTPLHWAASRDAVDTADLLIKVGADMNAATDTGITPLHWAASRNATNVLRLLVKSGADINRKTTKGYLPLHWAVSKGANEAAIMLAYQMTDEGTSSTASLRAEAVANDISETEAPEPSMEETIAALPRPVFGRTFIIPIGQGETLEFIWIEKQNIWMGKYEITNGQYRRFTAKHNSMFYEEFTLNDNQQPVVNVSWNDTRNFCNWLNKYFSDRLPAKCEFRLPTEEEWQVCARAGTTRKYPWGDRLPPKFGNYPDLTAKKCFPDWRIVSGYEDGYAVSCPVTDSGANEWGIYGMGGNVWEWCDDWYDNDQKYKTRHGGCWDAEDEASLRIDTRGFDIPEARYDNIGFRLAVGLKK